jgi:hypothetical protein
MLGEVFKVAAVMGKLRNEKLHNLYSASSNHIKKVRWRADLLEKRNEFILELCYFFIHKYS